VTKAPSFNIAKSVAALGVVASALLASAPAQAQVAGQVTANVPASINLIRPLELYVDRPLQFGPVAPSATGGVVRVSPDAAGARTNPIGTVTLLPPTAGMPVSSGQVRALGELNAAVSLDVEMPVNLANAAGASVDYTYQDNRIPAPLLSTPAGGGLGSYTFYMGGNVSFVGGEPGGLYQSVANVTAAYN
jgi:hypothetical protein